MTCTVRAARPSDGAALFAAWSDLRAHYAAADRRIIPAPVQEDEFLAGLDEIFGRKTSAAFVADDEGRLVGFISGGIEANQPDRLPARHATVGYLYVEPEYRRLGLGRLLFQEFARWAQSHEGVSHFEMAVLAADHHAEPFWRSLGFTPFIQRLWAPLSAADGPE